ncbi:MAG TPA: hypothetical protein VM888_08165 [Chitinophagaceae bacterium]|nr:hypothetical protein [Chitinophagaceae bacterium]
MKFLTLLSFIAILTFSCSNDKGQAAAPFCDTTCSDQTYEFKGTGKQNAFVTLTQKGCIADTLSWSSDKMLSKQKMLMQSLLDTTVRINKAALSCVVNDTSYAWITFNDCISGRGYLLQAFFKDEGRIKKYTSALTSFDKKFVVHDSIRAYCDYSAIYAVNVNTGKKVALYYKEELKKINFNNIHETIDSINFSRNRLFAVMKRNGNTEQIEKDVKL